MYLYVCLKNEKLKKKWARKIFNTKKPIKVSEQRFGRVWRQMFTILAVLLVENKIIKITIGVCSDVSTIFIF